MFRKKNLVIATNENIEVLPPQRQDDARSKLRQRSFEPLKSEIDRQSVVLYYYDMPEFIFFGTARASVSIAFVVVDYNSDE